MLILQEEICAFFFIELVSIFFLRQPCNSTVLLNMNTHSGDPKTIWIF